MVQMVTAALDPVCREDSLLVFSMGPSSPKVVAAVNGVLQCVEVPPDPSPPFP